MMGKGQSYTIEYLQNKTGNDSSTPPTDNMFTPALMSGSTLTAVPFFEYLSGLKITYSIKWNLYTHSIAEDDGRIFYSSYRSIKCITLSAMWTRMNELSKKNKETVEKRQNEKVRK